MRTVAMVVASDWLTKTPTRGGRMQARETVRHRAERISRCAEGCHLYQAEMPRLSSCQRKEGA